MFPPKQTCIKIAKKSHGNTAICSLSQPLIKGARKSSCSIVIYSPKWPCRKLAKHLIGNHSILSLASEKTYQSKTAFSGAALHKYCQKITLQCCHLLVEAILHKACKTPAWQPCNMTKIKEKYELSDTCLQLQLKIFLDRRSSWS